MADRPAILTARVEQNAKMEMCRNHLAAKAKADRPGEAPLDDVRKEAENALGAVADAGGSVAAVQGVECPCVRVGADECVRSHQ